MCYLVSRRKHCVVLYYCIQYLIKIIIIYCTIVQPTHTYSLVGANVNMRYHCTLGINKHVSSQR